MFPMQTLKGEPMQVFALPAPRDCTGLIERLLTLLINLQMEASPRHSGAVRYVAYIILLRLRGQAKSDVIWENKFTEHESKKMHKVDRNMQLLTVNNPI